MRTQASSWVARAAMGIAGAVLVVGAWPLEYLLAVIAGGGHGSPFGYTPAEATLGGAMLAFPVLLLLVGIALLFAARSGRWVPAAAIGLLLPLDFGVAAAALSIVNRPEPPVMYTPPPPGAVIPANPVMAAPACTPDGKCTRAPRPAELRSEPVGTARD
jgi:hypothetical protein